MHFEEVLAFAFDVSHTDLSWPWIAFSANETHLAFATSASLHTIETRTLASSEETRTFSLSSDLRLASFSIGKDGETLAVSAHLDTESGSIIATYDAAAGERKRVRLDALVGDADGTKAKAAAHAIAFDRSGTRLWVSAETEKETLLLLLDAASLTKIDVLRSPAFPRPALHELHLHAQDDAVLLVAACGEDGTFVRVAGFAGDVASAIPTALDEGGIAAGFVGFSADGARVHLVEADELRTHAWPNLDELSSVPLADDFVSSFSGAVIGKYILIDGADADSQEDAVMLFDQSAIRGVVIAYGRDVPNGMWAGRWAATPNLIVTVDAKGDPARARIWKPTLTPNAQYMKTLSS